ncbi:hypothetical protein [Desertibaculum subflavum]|uniref:hypothetical protein n=1 Tax=Desertibaculum subflavum TaxID=2268458 RepID=UPI000E66D91A
MSIWLEQTARKPAREPSSGRRWPLWLAGGAIGLAVAVFAAGDAVAPIADFLVTRVIEPFSQIALQGFLCL